MNALWTDCVTRPSRWQEEEQESAGGRGSNRSGAKRVLQSKKKSRRRRAREKETSRVKARGQIIRNAMILGYRLLSVFNSIFTRGSCFLRKPFLERGKGARAVV